jgi:FAD/FMN-containing dehydrogenase
MALSLDSYHRKRDAIVASVKSRPAGMKMSILKKTPAHQIHNRSWKSTCHRVDVSPLCDIIGYEYVEDRMGERCLAAVCEGQVTMGQLARATLQERQCVPRVVPELTSFTCAGLINGEGIQTSAYKYGVFTHNVLYMEVVLGNGDVVRCSHKENRELFVHMPESHGTIGIVTLVAVALTPALPFVRSTYMHYSKLEEFVSVFDKLVRAQQGAFLEGLVLSKTSYLIIASSFVSKDEAAKGPIFDPSAERFDDGGKYYYQYIRQDVVKKGQLNIKEDYIETWEFLFRPMRGMWWMLECVIDFPPVYNNRFARRLVDKKVHYEIQEKGGFEPGKHLTREDEQRCYVLQDMGILLKRLAEGIQWVEDRLGVYPLWICAVDAKRSLKTSEEFLAVRPWEREAHQKMAEDGFVVDIGIYGEPTVQPFYHKRVIRDLWKFVDAPSSWGVCYTKPDELKKKNHTIREKYHAIGAFPGLEEKVTYRGSVDDGLDETAIPNWRLYRDYGPWWKVKFPLLVLAFFAVVLAVLFGVFKLLLLLLSFVL